MERRNTIQRDLVLRTVRQLKCHATAEEIYTAIQSSYPSIGKGTVYRNLNILVEKGEIRRVEFPGEPDRFDHTLSRHYHILCVRCGRVVDVEPEPGLEPEKQLLDDRGFEILEHDILFKGICPECKKEEENKCRSL